MKGDSGGSAIQNDKIVGITSFGSTCGVHPFSYTKVSVYVDWINENMRNMVERK